MATAQQRALNDIRGSVVDTQEKIYHLEQKVKELQGEKSKLQKELETKKKEISSLKGKVSRLESDLKKQIQKHEVEIGRLTAMVETLKDENDQKESQMDQLREDMKDMKKGLEETKRHNASLEAQLQKMGIQQGASYTSQQELSLKSNGFLVFGEVCRQLQNKMFEEVSGRQVADFNYRVKDIDDYISEETDPQAAAEMEERWAKLRKRLGWDDKLVKTIKSIVNNRNVSAHPRVTQEDARSLLKEMEGKNMFPERGNGSAKKINALIDMWIDLVKAQ